MINIVKNSFWIVSFVLAFTVTTNAQMTTKNKSPFPVKYTSLVDQKIILKTITLAPVYDNVKGIYSEPIQKLLIDLLQSDKSWGYSEFPDFQKKIFIETFDTHPNDVLEALTKTNSQGLLTAYITKGPRGLNAKLKLFTQDQGLILIEESFEDLNTFEISKLRESFVEMYHNIKNKLPYRGFVLSRRGIDVTLNLGSMNGVKVGQELSLAQILKLSRHPKLKFLIGAEKEIIAKVKVTQVEDYLSFAQIIFEKESGVVSVGAKVLPTEFVSYPKPIINNEGVVTGDEFAKSKTSVMNENNANETTETTAQDISKNQIEEQTKEALLDKNNSFGVLTLQGVITQYHETTTLNSGLSASSSNALVPGVHLGAKIYPLENIFVTADTEFSSFGSNNTLAGSLPYQISYTMVHYGISAGYDYLLDSDGEKDPIKLSAALAFFSRSTDVTVTTPTALTSTKVNSLALQLRASMPLTPDYPFTVGGGFDLMLSPSFSETPVSSGSAQTTILSFGVFGLYPLNDHINIRADIATMNISTNFSGSGTRPNPASSNLIQMTNEKIGIEYLF